MAYIPFASSYIKRDALTLSLGQYCNVVDQLTGEERVISGPSATFLGADEVKMTSTQSAVKLEDTEYLRVLNTETAEIEHIRGPCLFIPSHIQEIQHRKSGYKLTSRDTLRIRDDSSGDIRMERGPQQFFPGVYDQVMEQVPAIVLKKGEYQRIIDNRTGQIRVEQGETLVFLGPYEDKLEEKKRGIVVDDLNAVLVQSISSGAQRLILEQQTFIPKPDDNILEARQKIVLEEYMIVVIKEKDGSFTFKRGTDEHHSFFLEPQTQLLSMRWSSGLRKERRDLLLTFFDMRPHFMWYEFEVRTHDNVELLLNLTFFWAISDIEAMVATSDDTVGDICSHARSQCIQAVSLITMEKFLQEFNNVVRSAVLDDKDQFYAKRGANIMELEVRSVTCKDAATQAILNEIIKESTERINRLQAQESANEVSLRRIQGDIEAESLKYDLVKLQEKVVAAEGSMRGGSEGKRVQTFLDELGEMAQEQKITLFNTIQRHDALTQLSGGNARLFFTPNDVNLRIDG